MTELDETPEIIEKGTRSRRLRALVGKVKARGLIARKGNITTSGITRLWITGGAGVASLNFWILMRI